MAKKKTNKKETEEKKEIQALSPSQYFDILKGAKQNITTEALKESYDVFIALAEKYKKLGQKESIQRLCFLAETLIKEEKLIELGITTYIYKDKIEDYIDNVNDDAVKIIELARYMREIPDELVETVEKTRDIFDEFYVVFTDYTGKEERKVTKERKDKDPILFGVFKTDTNVGDRFYFLGDWVDEFCDLTLDKMVEQYKSKKNEDILHESEIPKTAEELTALLHTYKEVMNDKNQVTNLTTLSSFFNETTATTTQVSNEPVQVVTPVYKQEIGKRVSFIDKVRSIFK